jgi:PAS domain S-box-containing protein
MAPFPAAAQHKDSENAEDLGTLARAFEIFNETTTRLEEAHRRLGNRVAEIDRELERKNRELADANRSLARKISELDETRRYLDSVIASMQDGLATVDLSGKVLTWNRAAERVTAIPSERAVGSSLESLLAPEPAERFAGCLKEAGQSETEFEWAWRDEEGQHRHVRIRCSPLANASGERFGLLAVFQDLTRVRLLEEKVRRRDRLSALGELAAGVAHEMRNPLTTVRGYVQLLPRQAGDAEFLREMSRNVIDEIDRLSGLTCELLDLARPGGECRSLVRAADVLEEVFDFHAHSGDSPEIVMIPETLDRSVMVSIDRDRWKQVLVNLRLNAIQAMGGRGEIFYGVERTEGKIRADGGEQALARTWVRDSGPGIPVEVLPRIFDPFFTTKDRGTGLGLTLSHAIVEEHGGVIRAGNGPEGGAEFSIYIPLAREEKR